MLNEMRREDRSKAYAHVILVEENIPGYLRDVSESGCQISFIRQFPVKKEDLLTLIIKPGKVIGIPDCKVIFQVIWTRSDSMYFSVGGRVKPQPGDKNQENLQKLYEYYT